MHNTQDNHTYYKRHPASNKIQNIFDFVKATTGVQKIFDVGCNNGNISYRLQKELNKKVWGVDISGDLQIPNDYKFTKLDITKYRKVYYNDLTLFLSLYHHILGAYGLKTADDLFFKLLLSTKLLIFDTGNTSEKSRSSTYWHIEQRKHFQNEAELLNHFNIDYHIIGNWDIAGGKRNLVVFDKNSFDKNVTVVKEYQRYAGKQNQHKGLVKKEDIKKPNKINKEDFDENGIFHGVTFTKLQIANKLFFAKKHKLKKYENDEHANIVRAYAELPETKLIKYYGFSEKYGFVYEWLDKIVYQKRIQLTIGNKTLKDVDVIEANGEEKYIDFHW